jgi:two-component system response regulator HydG
MAVRLLIVDDEAALLNLLQRYLTRLGYEVEVAGDAEDALDRFAAAPGSYACVLTDLKLPGMNGEALLERLRELRPGLPALISSGYPYQPRSALTAFVQKPYLPGMLAAELERLLKKKSRGAS